MTDKESVHFIDKLEKRNKQLLTALRSAKGVIEYLHNKSLGGMDKYFWKDFQNIRVMKRINKAIKNG